jgi:hypothetical protein
MRYKFHDQLEAVKHNAGYKLPEDINKPVIDFLESIECAIGVKLVKAAQEKIKYCTIELVRQDVPNAKIEIQIDCGMAQGYKQYLIENDEKWRATSYSTIKNYNLDKSKPKEVKK